MKLSDNPQINDGFVEFYERVIRTEPWLHIIARPGPGGDEMEVSFRLEATHPPTQYEWAFGDGDTSVVAEPIHRYGAPGTYRVAVTVDGPLGREHERVKSISIPLLPVARIGVEP